MEFKLLNRLVKRIKFYFWVSTSIGQYISYYRRLLYPLSYFSPKSDNFYNMILATFFKKEFFYSVLDYSIEKTINKMNSFSY